MRAAYTGLHRAGHAHSLEVWAGERLVGGLYGVLVGGVFSGESMFHREPDAAKVALVDLDARLASAGALIVDTQQETEHLRRLGQRLISRTHFLDLLDRLRDLPVRLDETRMPADRLLT
jgi:leucyl/phenylalanyl-tRNA--protein transferase